MWLGGYLYNPSFPYDHHIHSTISDGTLSPQEIADFYKGKNYIITDHVHWNSRKLVKKIIEQVPIGHRGAEIHTQADNPAVLDRLALYLKLRGIEVVLVHIFTIEQMSWVCRHSKYIDIIAHPGPIPERLVEICAKRGIALEVTSSLRRCWWNIRTRRLARKYGVKLSYGSDAHNKSQLLRKLSK